MNALNKLKPCLALLLSISLLFGSVLLEVAFVLAQDQGVFEVKLTDDEAELDADLQEEGTSLDADNRDGDYNSISAESEYDEYQDGEIDDQEDHVVEVDEREVDSDIELGLDTVAEGTVGSGGARWTLDSDGVVRVEGGFISSSGVVNQSPWHSYRGSIRQIIFTEEVEATGDLSNLFRSLTHVTSIEGLERIDTSSVTNKFAMFSGASSLTSLDLSNFDTRNVTSMQGMFFGTSSLTSLDLSNFDTSNVGDMFGMFQNAHSLTSLDLSSFDTSNVTNMSAMFNNARSLQQLTLGSDFIFRGNTFAALPNIEPTSQFTGYWQNVGEGSFKNPTGEFVFTSAGLMANYDGSTMADTFVWQPVVDVEPDPTSCPVVDYQIATGKFLGENGACWVLDDQGVVRVGAGSISGSGIVNQSPWHAYRDAIRKIIFTEEVEATSDLSNLFRGLSDVTSMEGLERIDTSDVENMNSMFNGASSLTTLDLSSFDTRRVTSMNMMFVDTSTLTSLDVSNFDTSRVTDMSGMFQGTSGLTSLDVSNFNTTRVTNMGWMFFGASSLESLDLSSFDTSNVIRMYFMFADASSLTELNLSNFDTSSVENMWLMFGGTSMLQRLVLGSDFSFLNQSFTPGLPNVERTSEFTGYWQNVGEGSVRNPTGEFVFTSAGLMADYEGSTMADTFVWQPVNRMLTINNVPESANPTGQTRSGEKAPNTIVTIIAGESSYYEFLGWVRGEDVLTSGNIDDIENVLIEYPRHTFTKPDESITYTALWGNEEGEIGVPNNVYVTYTFDWGLEGVPNPTGEVRYDTVPSLPTDIPVNPDYRFDGWNPVVGSITEDTTFQAIWTPTRVREPDLESETNIDDEYERVTRPPSGSRLPQTGAIIVSSLLGGVALVATGVAVASKKRKGKK